MKRKRPKTVQIVAGAIAAVLALVMILSLILPYLTL